jgi:protein-S-isoprenylcysteine O-methyltransferase Ste14
MLFRFLATAFLVFASVESFAPIRTPVRLTSVVPMSSRPPEVDGPTQPAKDIMSKLTSVANQDTADQIFDNVVSGEFGSRGEAYVIAQVFLVVCILFGGLPFLGGTLQFLFGPILMAIGAATILLGTLDMGASLSPWPVPTGEKLVTSGVFSKVRHPLYAGLIAFMTGLSISTGSAERLILTGVLLYILEVKSDFEEKELSKQYTDYGVYKKEVTGKFFPSELQAMMPWNTKGKADA